MLQIPADQTRKPYDRCGLEQGAFMGDDAGALVWHKALKLIRSVIWKIRVALPLSNARPKLRALSFLSMDVLSVDCRRRSSRHRRSTQRGTTYVANKVLSGCLCCEPEAVVAKH